MAGHENMPALHKVRDGEWVSRIADLYGVSNWKKEIWDLPDNEDLRDRRDPYVLGPEDDVAMPVAECRQEPSGTAQQHPFEIKLVNDVLRVRILKIKEAAPPKGEEPSKPDEYIPTTATKLEFRQHREGTHPVFSSSVAINNGLAEIVLFRETTVVELRYEEKVDDKHVTKHRIRCTLGKLRPMSMKDEGEHGTELRTRGVQQRLRAMGFVPGPLDGIVGPRTRAAVRTFQELIQKDPVKGQLGSKTKPDINAKIDEKTIDAIREAYGA